jgi:hypothetical protein
MVTATLSTLMTRTSNQQRRLRSDIEPYFRSRTKSNRTRVDLPAFVGKRLPYLKTTYRVFFGFPLAQLLPDRAQVRFILSDLFMHALEVAVQRLDLTPVHK